MLNQILESIRSLPPFFLIIPAIFILYGIFFVIHVIRDKKRKNTFFVENPDASKIYCAYGMKGIKSVSVTLNSINGQLPKHFFQTGTNYVYGILPGTHVLEVEATTNRPGLMYKNVTHTYGPAKIEVVVEAKKEYTIGFDTKQETFTFTEGS